MATKKISVTVNGVKHTAEIEPRLLLVHFIRENLCLTGTHIGCDTSGCGACTVLLDGRSVKSCTVLAVQTNVKSVKTIEEMEEGGIHTMKEGLKEEHGLQCGFCTPGMIMRAAELLEKNPNPTEDDIRWGISGNLCRCTGYNNIVKAVQYAAAKINEKEAVAV